jgi:LmbE family N-acetylglucosaminyl deacetylase
MDFTEAWETPKEILVILAHPDDPEFFLGGTIARWVKTGHKVRYVLLTRGDKGAQNEKQTSAELIQTRNEEQAAAIAALGVLSVEYLDYEDGYLFPDLEMRKKIVRCIRKYQPQIVVTCDPTNIFPNEYYINHPDHRYAGQVVLDAVFPAVGNHLFFPELIEEGFPPHQVEEVWMSLTDSPNVVLDVTEFLGLKIEALKQHASQIGDPGQFEQRMLDRLEETEDGKGKYQEKFRRIKFRRSNA